MEDRSTGGACAVGGVSIVFFGTLVNAYLTISDLIHPAPGWAVWLVPLKPHYYNLHVVVLKSHLNPPGQAALYCNYIIVIDSNYVIRRRLYRWLLVNKVLNWWLSLIIHSYGGYITTKRTDQSNLVYNDHAQNTTIGLRWPLLVSTILKVRDKSIK